MQKVSRSSVLFNTFYLMIPLIGFYLIDHFCGLKEGILAAIILSVAEMIWVYSQEKRFEPFTLGSTLLIILMGAISWHMESAILLLLKPAIFEAIFGGIFLFTSLLGKPFMEIMAKKQFGKDNINAFQMEYFKGVNWRIGIFFLIHAGMITYAAFYLSKEACAFVTTMLFFILFAIYMVFEIGYSRYKALRFRRKMENQQAFLEYQKNLIEQIRRGNKNDT